MHDLKLYTIVYSSESYSHVEPGFLVLDNRENLRPDWREYWPIRNYLLNEQLEEHCYYGFFSPKFHQKTGISCQQVKDFVQIYQGQYDVFLFTSFPDFGAVSLNVFEQKEYVDKGFTEISQKFVELLGFDVDLNKIVMDSRSVIFSNFFVASIKFWMEWLQEHIERGLNVNTSTSSSHPAM